MSELRIEDLLHERPDGSIEVRAPRRASEVMEQMAGLRGLISRHDRRLIENDLLIGHDQRARARIAGVLRYDPFVDVEISAGPWFPPLWKRVPEYPVEAVWTGAGWDLQRIGTHDATTAVPITTEQREDLVQVARDFALACWVQQPTLELMLEVAEAIA